MTEPTTKTFKHYTTIEIELECEITEEELVESGYEVNKDGCREYMDERINELVSRDEPSNFSDILTDELFATFESLNIAYDFLVNIHTTVNITDTTDD